jgi:hypothetical protein
MNGDQVSTRESEFTFIFRIANQRERRKEGAEIQSPRSKIRECWNGREATKPANLSRECTNLDADGLMIYSSDAHELVMTFVKESESRIDGIHILSYTAVFIINNYY